MFDKFKQIAELKKMQSQLKKQRVKVEKDGVKVVVNGNMNVDYLELNPELDIKKQEKILKDLFNDATKEMQKQMAEMFKNNPMKDLF